MLSRLLVLLAAAVAGCAAEPTNEELFAPVAEAHRRYIDCAFDAAKRYQASRSTVDEIVEAVQASCANPLAEYEKRAEAYSRAMDRSLVGDLRASARARRMTDDLKAIVRSHIVRMVVESR